MKEYLLTLVLATGVTGVFAQDVPVPLQIATKLIEQEKALKKGFHEGKVIERKMTIDDHFLLLKLRTEPGPAINGYNVLEILSSDKSLEKWPRREEDIAGKTIDYYADYQLNDRSLETSSSTTKDGKTEYHFILVGEPQQLPKRGVYERISGEYQNLVRRILKKLTY